MFAHHVCITYLAYSLTNVLTAMLILTWYVITACIDNNVFYVLGMLTCL